MANEDDVIPAIVICQECRSVYAARQQPNGEIEIIGREGCGCGVSDLKVVEDPDEENIEFGGN